MIKLALLNHRQHGLLGISHASVQEDFYDHTHCLWCEGKYSQSNWWYKSHSY